MNFNKLFIVVLATISGYAMAQDAPRQAVRRYTPEFIKQYKPYCTERPADMPDIEAIISASHAAGSGLTKKRRRARKKAQASSTRKVYLLGKDRPVRTSGSESPDWRAQTKAREKTGSDSPNWRARCVPRPIIIPEQPDEDSSRTPERFEEYQEAAAKASKLPTPPVVPFDDPSNPFSQLSLDEE